MKFTFKLSKSAIAANFLATGKAQCSHIEFHVDELSKEHREILMAFNSSRNLYHGTFQPEVGYFDFSKSTSLEVNASDFDGAMQELKGFTDNALKEKEAEAKAKEAAQAASNARDQASYAAAQKFIDTPDEEIVEKGDLPFYYSHCIGVESAPPKNEVWEAACKKVDRLKALIADKKAQAYADAKASLRNWATENGSDYLKALIDGEFDWGVVAETEYFAATAPEGFAETDQEWQQYITTPTPFQLECLRAAGCGKLVVMCAEGEEEDDVAIELTLTAPNGTEKCLYKFI